MINTFKLCVLCVGLMISQACFVNSHFVFQSIVSCKCNFGAFSGLYIVVMVTDCSS